MPPRQMSDTVAGTASAAHRLAGPETLPWILVILGLCALYVPTFYTLATTVWTTDAQGHGPIVLGLGLWLIWRRWPEIHDRQGARPQALAGAVLLVISCLSYAVGRLFEFPLFEVGSLISSLAACVLMLRGPAHLRLMAFPLFFLAFMVPLPNSVVDAVTQPMKLAVSAVADELLYRVGYPISRQGVTLTIGQYQLLVADACAGLQTLFSLEAMGLLYLNVVTSSSMLRNVTMGLLIIPISFMANVIRVMALVLIFYHFGDEAGQGFLHGFAGIVLFLSGLILLIAVDSLFRFGDTGGKGKSGSAPGGGQATRLQDIHGKGSA